MSPIQDDALGLKAQAAEAGEPAAEEAERYIHMSLNDDGSINTRWVGLTMPELIRLHWYFGYNLFRQQATDETRTPPAIIRKPEDTARDRIILPGKAGMAGGPNREQRRRRPDA